MGQFSWIYSDTNKQVIDNKRADSYLLVPKAFQQKYGKSIYERCYDGYGHFGGHDVYELVAEWNREFLSRDMLRDEPKLENYGGMYPFEKENLRKMGVSEEEIEKKDFEQKEHFYNLAVKRYETSINRLDDYRTGSTDDEMCQKYGAEWKRSIGIDIACYDDQNESLPYPIKITSREMEYKNASPSKSDPNQGWEG